MYARKIRLCRMLSIVQYQFYAVRKDTQEKKKKAKSSEKDSARVLCAILHFSVVVHGTFLAFYSSSSHFLVMSRRHFRNSGAGCIGIEDH